MNSSPDSFTKLLLNMPSDEEISGRLFWQASVLLGNELNFGLKGAQRSQFIDILLDTMIKCHAMKYHIQSFIALEQSYKESVFTNTDTRQIYRSHEMLFELEAFLFQLKSSLDIGVKMLGILIPGRFRTYTFEEKGSKLVNGLEQFNKDKNSKHDLIFLLIKVLQDDRDAWLEEAVNLRDTISHYKTFAEFNYQTTWLEGKVTYIPPKIAGMTPSEYMSLTYQNCIEFLQDFMCLSIGLFLPPIFSVGLTPSDNCRFGKPIAQYIKFGVGSLLK